MGIVFVSSEERIRCFNELWDWIISAMWNDFETVVSEWWCFCEGGEILQIDKWLGANWQLLWKLTIFQCETRCGIDTGVGFHMPNKYSNQMGYTNGWQMVSEWQLMDGSRGEWREVRSQKAVAVYARIHLIAFAPPSFLRWKISTFNDISMPTFTQ